MRGIIVAFLLSCSLVSRSDLLAQDFFPITAFSKEELIRGEPVGWKSHKGLCREIKNRLMPRVIETEGRTTVYVSANDSGSILFKPVHIDPETLPFLNWNWKVSNILPESREKEVGGDDYPAVVCIVYGSTIFSIPYKYKILIYAYGNNLPIGERFENPCEARARVIIVESGEKGVGKWLNYKVNHYHDFIQEFGHKPPRIIYVGLQTNADRTHGKVEAWYSDIVLSKF